VVAQDRAELGPRHLLGVALPVLEHQFSVLGMGIVLAVPDVVKDVDGMLGLAEPPVQLPQCRAGHPFDLDQSTLDQRPEGDFDGPDLSLGIQSW